MLNDGLFLKGSSGFFDALLEPLAAIALLWMMLLLPSRLAQMAMLGAGAVRGGFVSRAVSYAAGSQMRDSARQHLPGWAGGRSSGASDQRARATDSRLGARLSAESVLAASKAAGAGGVACRHGAAAAAAGVASGGRAGGADGTVGLVERAGGGLAASGAGAGQRARVLAAAAGEQPRRRSRRAAGLQRPSWRQDHFDAEMLEASLREQRQPVSAEQARQRASMRFPPRPRARCRVWSPITGRGRGSTSPTRRSGSGRRSEREAIRTLAAASPEVRAQAFADGSGVDGGIRRERRPERRQTAARAGAAIGCRPSHRRQRSG